MRKTPQDKKRASYLYDGRNSYGEHSKVSRSAIPRHKRDVNRSNRRGVATRLASLGTRNDPAVADEIEARVKGAREERWQKSPDQRLGDWVINRLKRRATLGIDEETDSQRKIASVEQNQGRGTQQRRRFFR